MTLLTEQEITKAWDSHIVPVLDKNGINPIVFARAIESAVIAKIKAQGPDCYVDYAHTMMRTGKGIDAPVGAKFYRLPDEGEHDDND